MERKRLAVLSFGSVASRAIESLLRSENAPDATVSIERIAIADRDRVSPENLSRGGFSVAQCRAGVAKADCAVALASELAPTVRIVPIVGDIEAEAAVEFEREVAAADLVLGAPDNSAATLALANVAFRHRKAVVQSQVMAGGIAVVTRVVPPGQCLECTELALAIGLKAGGRYAEDGSPLPEARAQALDWSVMAASAFLAALALEQLARPAPPGTRARVSVHALTALPPGEPLSRLLGQLGQTTVLHPPRAPNCPVCRSPRVGTPRRLFEGGAS